MPFGRKSPLEALALPGVMLAYKYSQFRQRRREAASRRVTERELSALHHKIDKLLSKLEEESEPDPPTSQEDECVICINARATMQTSPCGHRVVCRRCFVKTIQSAVAQRLLPLRCVICRARVNRLTSSSGSWRIQESASSYSMGAKSWASAGVHAGGVITSASSYSMNDAHSEHHAFHQPTLHTSAAARHHYAAPRGAHGRVSQSDSLYSMSSTGSAGSSLSGYSHYSKTSSISSSGPCSPASPAAITGTAASANHLAPPSPNAHHHQHHNQHQVISPSGSSSCSSASVGSLSPRDTGAHHSHHGGCPSGCSGAVPRKPLHMLSNSTSASASTSSSSSSSGSGSGSGSGAMTPLPTHTYPGRRHVKSRLLDLQNRLPPIKEFRSPAKVPHPSPVHVSNPRFRYASYTKSSGHELAPLLRESASPPPPRRPSPMNIQLSCTALAPPPLKAGGAKICPVTSKNSLPKNAYVMPKDKKPQSTGGAANSKAPGSRSAPLGGSNSSASKVTSAGASGSSGVSSVAAGGNCKPHSSASSRSFPLFSNSSNSSKEKADNKKNESMERKKKEEKLKMKAEKEARKEEKRLAKEEERMAKILAKEEKKRGKKEAKELLLANDGNNKK
ncbi:protein dissatisfaction [Drosophila albomicans]|uniref:Protein dissatisfaction n=1 Tax=Drosophila albomicans TaxID=7291 RepID=A0A6P8WY95_DROAB|nr:protein dissatisfaction [Drosophila albomicans]XP_034106636.1 protein dissatisfaction [Drosophila albomicans]XP_034106637.1 protein dissatisfaction [Drosophila albomicans]XP_034106639.1 protein dissatisfaction [Drosophila albomicans]XP_051860281.1 protein dissatisfaction [Drosophila albomicans]